MCGRSSAESFLPIEAPMPVVNITPPKSEATKLSKRSKQSVNVDVSVRHSLRTQLIALFMLLLVGCVSMIAYVTVRINQSGTQWSNVTETQLRAKVVVNMQSIVDAKATYAKVCNYHFFCYC
jgi:hypothetical protein